MADPSGINKIRYLFKVIMILENWNVAAIFEALIHYLDVTYIRCTLENIDKQLQK